MCFFPFPELPSFQRLYIAFGLEEFHSFSFSFFLSFITYVFGFVSFFSSVLLFLKTKSALFSEQLCFLWLRLLRMLGFYLWIHICPYTFSVAKAIEQVHCTAFGLLRNDGMQLLGHSTSQKFKNPVLMLTWRAAEFVVFVSCSV